MVVCVTLPLVEVWRGEYKGKKIAIKSMKEIKSGQAVQQFLAEASIMT